MAASDKPALNGADIRRNLAKKAEKEAVDASTDKAAKATTGTAEKKG